MGKTKRPSELHCYRPRKPISDCDEQLSLNLRRSLQVINKCRDCGGITYTKEERRARLCFECNPLEPSV